MAPDADGPGARPGARALAGRDHEVRSLEAALRRLRDRTTAEGRAIALVGEPGIGKSALLSAVTASARVGGVPVLAAHGHGFHPLDLPVAPPGVGRDPHRRTAPVLATLDDLHRLADDRVADVRRLIRETAARPVLLVMAYRERQLSLALAEALSRAVSEGRLDLWRLGPLSLEHTRALLGDRPDLAALHRAGQGNPGYLKVLAAGAEASADVGTAILGELAELDRTALAVIQAAAVLGEPFHPELMAEVAGLEVADTMAALDTLAHLDLVRPARPAPQLALRHRAVGEVVYQRLEPGRRLTLHARAEAAFAERSAPIAQRAHHVARAADPNRPDHATTLIAAARETLHSAPTLAADHLETALSLLREDAPRRHEAQVLLARARLLTGNTLESRALLNALRPDPTGRALDGSAVADTSKAEQRLGRYAEAAAIARSGLASLADHDTAAAAALHIELADAALDQQQYETARQHAHTAAAIARRHHDRAGEANALAQASQAHLFIADQAAAEATATRAAELVDAASDATVLSNLQSLYQLGFTEGVLGHLAAAERHLTRGAALSRRSGQTYILPTILKSLGDTLLRSGNLERALAAFDEVAQDTERGSSPATQAITMAQRGRALLWRGGPDDPREALALAEAAAEIAGGAPTTWAVAVRCQYAEIVLLTGDPARSRWLLLDAVGGPALPLLTMWRRPRWCDLLAQTALAEGDRAAAGQWAGLGEESVAGFSDGSRRAFALRARMWAHAAHGDVEPAVKSAEQAVENFAVDGERLEMCRTLLAAAALVLDAGAAEAGRAQDVGGWLGRAASLAEQCGSARLAGEVADERRRLAECGSRPPRPADALAPLSARELQIAHLTSTGMTSKEIADALFLSLRTVDTHLGRIYRKLGVQNRVGLTRTVLNNTALNDTAPNNTAPSSTAPNTTVPAGSAPHPHPHPSTDDGAAGR